jgi:hypothetical protein
LTGYRSGVVAIGDYPARIISSHFSGHATNINFTGYRSGIVAVVNHPVTVSVSSHKSRNAACKIAYIAYCCGVVAVGDYSFSIISNNAACILACTAYRSGVVAVFDRPAAIKSNHTTDIALTDYRSSVVTVGD